MPSARRASATSSPSTGDVVVHYRDYILRADKVVYHQSTTELEAEGHLQVAGGPNDVLINASHGDMRLNMHTARFFNVNGSQGVRSAGRTGVYSTANPFLFSGQGPASDRRGQLPHHRRHHDQLPPSQARLADHLPRHQPGQRQGLHLQLLLQVSWRALFYLPYLRHPVDETGRESGLLIPVLSNSSIKGFIVGEQVYWVINRSMDMVVGSEYYSKRGWAPNGDFRYKGRGLDHLIVRWNALLDRGVEQQVGNTIALRRRAACRPPTRARPIGYELVNQGGVDVVAQGRKDLTSRTRMPPATSNISPAIVYRLVFNDNYSQAVSSEVASDVALTHAHNGLIPSVSLDRFQTFASSTNGDEARILHLPSLRYDVLDRPLGASPLYWGLGSSLELSEPLRAPTSMPATSAASTSIRISRCRFSAGGWSVVPEAALRDTSYTISQIPDLTGANGGTPTISHDPLNRSDLEASIDIRPPALERDFALARWNRVMRHVIEPELTYRYVGGIGTQARNVLLIDTTDIATNTNEVGFSLTQRFYLRPTRTAALRCRDDAEASGECPGQPREWASWQIAQKFFIDPNFGGALIPGRRNVFDSTLDLSGVAFLTSPRNLSPITSRLRFEAIDNLRIEWDLDYDPKAGRLGADNLYAGYSWGRTTVGLGHALLNAVDESGSAASTIKSQQLQPFLPSASPAARLQPCRQRRLRLCPRPAAIRRRAGHLQLGLLRPHLRLPALRARLGPRRDPVPLQLHPGQLRLRRRHPPLQLRLPRPHPAACVLDATPQKPFAFLLSSPRQLSSTRRKILRAGADSLRWSILF